MSESIDVPGGWVEIPPEQHEDRLFVSEEAHESGIFEGFPKRHLCIYKGDNYTVEYADGGEYTFKYPETVDELETAVHGLMGGSDE